MNASFKRKDAFFVSEWLRQRGREAEKNSARCLKADINFVFCMINATTLTKRFHDDEKIIM